MAKNPTFRETHESSVRQMQEAARENRQEFSSNRVSVPPHLEGMVDKNSAARARDAAAKQDRDLSTVPTARKP